MSSDDRGRDGVVDIVFEAEMEHAFAVAVEEPPLGAVELRRLAQLELDVVEVDEPVDHLRERLRVRVRRDR